MAGRGRGMTLPAWMTKEGAEQQAAAVPQDPGGLNGEHFPRTYEMAPYPFVLYFQLCVVQLFGNPLDLRGPGRECGLSVADASQPSVPLDTNTSTTTVVVVLAGVVYFVGLG